MIKLTIIKYSLLILLIKILFLILYKEYTDTDIDNDTFMNKKDTNFENDGNMTFDYLTNNNYKNEVLNKYYLNDDIKKDGQRINIHPYQKKNYRNLYGIPEYQIQTNYKYNKNIIFSDYIYKLYGVRR